MVALDELGKMIAKIENAKVQYMISCGTIYTGFRFYGPFNSKVEAERWAIDNNFDVDILPISNPWNMPESEDS